MTTNASGTRPELVNETVDCLVHGWACDAARRDFDVDDGPDLTVLKAMEKLEEMAQAFHKRYVDGSTGKLPANMRPWPKLDDTFQTANREQARYAVEILTDCGFAVRNAADPGNPVVFAGFTDSELERMAEMEHGRWNVERLRDGWRPGTPRDDARKVHNCLVTWADLPDDIRHYDSAAVKEFPAILAKAKLEVVRK